MGQANLEAVVWPDCPLLLLKLPGNGGKKEYRLNVNSGYTQNTHAVSSNVM